MVLFCLFQTNSNKAVDILSKLSEWVRNIYAIFYYYKDLDEDLAWLTQKTEEPKCNKGQFTSPPHRNTPSNCTRTVK